MLIPISDEDLKSIQARAAANLLVTNVYGLLRTELNVSSGGIETGIPVIDDTLIKPLRLAFRRVVDVHGRQITFDIEHVRALYAADLEQLKRRLDLYDGLPELVKTCQRCSTTPLAAFVIEVRVNVFARGPYGNDDLRQYLRERCHPYAVQFAENLTRTGDVTARGYDRLLRNLFYATLPRGHQFLRNDQGRFRSALERRALVSFLDDLQLVIDVPSN